MVIRKLFKKRMKLKQNPFNIEKFITMIKEMKMELLGQAKQKQIITIAIGSGKGGVGKSSFTVNLAHILKRLSLKIGIIDADLYGPSLSIMLPVEKPLQVSDSGVIQPAVSHGIKVVSLSHFPQGKEATIVRAPIANATIKKFTREVDWAGVDVVLIDLPPGTGDIQLTLMQTISLNHGIVVTTPSKVSLVDVKKSIEMYKRMNVPLLGLVENMSYLEDSLTKERIHPFGQGGGRRLANECQIPFLGCIPLDEEVSHCLDSGKSIFENKRVSPAMQSLEEIAIEIRSKICDTSDSKKSFEAVGKVSDHFFEVSKDKTIYRFRFSDVQRNCPCARCVDEITGHRIVEEESINENVSVQGIRSIGNYALKFSFNRGCSQGIYTWECLRKIDSENGCCSH